MSRNKCFFFNFEYHVLYVLYPFVIYLMSLAAAASIDCRLPDGRRRKMSGYSMMDLSDFMQKVQ
jgi:hypothetical protein